MAEWTSEKREQMYKYLSEGKLQDAITLVESMTVLKQSDFAPKDKKAMESFIGITMNNPSLQTEIVHSLSHPSKVVVKLIQYLLRSFTEFPPEAFVWAFNIESSLDSVAMGPGSVRSNIETFLREQGLPENEVVNFLKNRKSQSRVFFRRDFVLELVKGISIFPTDVIDQAITPYKEFLSKVAYLEYNKYKINREKYIEKAKKKSNSSSITQSSDTLANGIKSFLDTGSTLILEEFIEANPNLTTKKLNMANDENYQSLINKLNVDKDALRALTKLLFSKTKTGPLIAKELFEHITPLPYQMMIEELNQAGLHAKDTVYSTDAELRPLKSFVEVYFRELTTEALSAIRGFNESSTPFYMAAAMHLVGENLLESTDKYQQVVDNLDESDTNENAVGLTWYFRYAHEKIYPIHAVATIPYPFKDEILKQIQERSPNIASIVINNIREQKYTIHEWGAKMICQHPDLVRAQGEDCLELLSLGLWRTKSAEIRDTIFRIHYFAEQGHCTPQEAIDTISQVFDSDQSAAWNHAARSIKDLLKMDKDATINCADRLNEIIELDSKYQKTFAPLLKRTGN